MQKALSLFFAIIALLFFGISILFNPNSASEIVEHTLKNSRQIEAMLLEGVSFVENFRNQNSILPTRTEFDAWAYKQQSISPYSINNTFLETNLADIELRLNDPDIQKTGFGVPSQDSYMIGIWRGEWFEYYVSWTQTTTLTSEASDYFLIETALNDFFLYLLLFLISALVSILLWKRSIRPTLG